MPVGKRLNRPEQVPTMGGAASFSGAGGGKIGGQRLRQRLSGGASLKRRRVSWVDRGGGEHSLDMFPSSVKIARRKITEAGGRVTSVDAVE